MKKTKKNKKGVNTSKKVIKKNSLFYNKWFILGLIILALALAIFIISYFQPTGNIINGNAITGNAFLDEPASGIFVDATSWLDMGTTWKDIIIYMIVLGVIFVMLLDILLLTSIFSTWVSAILAGAMAIIGALVGIIRSICIALMTFMAGFGMAAGFLEIAVSIIVFIGLTLGSSKLALFAAKRRAQREHIKSIKGAGEATSAIAGLRAIQAEFLKSKRQEKI